MKLLLSNIVYLTIGLSCTVLANVEINELREATGSLENKIESHSQKLEALLKELSSMKSKRESAATLPPSLPEPFIEENKVPLSPNLPEQIEIEQKGSNDIKPLQEADNEKPIENYPSQDESLHSDFIQVIDSVYNLSLSYSLSFPFDADFKEYQLEYDLGHHFEAKLYRNWESFFVGFSIGAKIFKNKNLSMPYTVGSMELPADGANRSVFTSLLIGTEHYLNNHTFVIASAGLGFGKAWDEIEVGGIHIFDDSDSFLYGMLQLGIGYAFDESYSLVAFYQLDAQGSRNHFETQYFNQVGLGLGIHY